MNRALQALFATLLLSGCTYSVHQVALGEFNDLPPAARGRPIEAEAEQPVFLATGNTDFADEAMARLARSCPQGRVAGIRARYSTSLGFVKYTNYLKLTAFCVDEPTTAASHRMDQVTEHLSWRGPR